MLAVIVCVAQLAFIVFLDLEAKECVMEDMRLALTEQEETQERMEQVLDEKLGYIQELSRGKTEYRKGPQCFEFINQVICLVCVKLFCSRLILQLLTSMFELFQSWRS